MVQMQLLLLAVAAIALATTAAVAAAADTEPLRCVMYLTGQHPVVPDDKAVLRHVSHVVLAFMGSQLFNEPEDVRSSSVSTRKTSASWPLFTSVEAVRAQLAPGTRVMVALGGWGDTAGFVVAARSAATRQRFARNVAAMVAATGADGVDIDWEYPGGNGEDYRQVPNADKAWEAAAFPLLLAELRAALGPDRLLSAAVPGKPEDIDVVFPEGPPATTTALANIVMASLDFLNVMAYDLMNRRNNVTTHHSGTANSLAAIDAYVRRGFDPRRLHLGLAFYVKYFRTEHDDCLRHLQQNNPPTALGCRTLLLEDPQTGADLGRTGAFAWHDPVPSEAAASFARAQTDGVYEPSQGGYCYWDAAEDLWWTWETAEAIVAHKFPQIVDARQLGGVFAWGLGEDGPAFRHLQAVNTALDQRASNVRTHSEL